jgi:hypothetical protein
VQHAGACTGGSNRGRAEAHAPLFGSSRARAPHRGAADGSMPPRVREAVRQLARQRERRAAAGLGGASRPLAVVVSGAGPVGLRCAVECALCGMTVSPPWEGALSLSEDAAPRPRAPPRGGSRGSDQ